MNRIEKAFAAAKAANRAAFVSYVCAGDPDPETSLEALVALAENGADILEIGMPFSDPLADGLTNQLASQRALEAGMNSEKFFALIAALRRATDKPVVLYTYLNLILAHGVEAFVKRCAATGVDGILALDCPPEEAGDLITAGRAHGVANIFIVAPTTKPERIAHIARHASGFIYYVSRTGVTGERAEIASGIAGAVAEIRKHTTLPVAVGFGVSTPEQVRAVAAAADGVVVGSALVNVIAERRANPREIAGAMADKVRLLASGLR